MAPFTKILVAVDRTIGSQDIFIRAKEVNVEVEIDLKLGDPARWHSLPEVIDL